MTDKSPFSQAAAELVALGYHTLPLLPPDHPSDGKGKAPGAYRSGGWAHMSDWQRFRDRQPTDFEMRLWLNNWPRANIGILLGSPAGEGRVLIAVDVDTTDPDEFDAILRALPRTPMSKKGAKGITNFYAAPAEIRSRGYKIAKRTVLDLLTGNQTRQTVAPPSVHPDGPIYAWLSGPVPAADLPLFDADALTVLEETLETLGWGAAVAADPDKPAAAPAPARVREADEESTVWRDLNDDALANLDRWVPELNLYGLKAVRRGGYEAVATWRESSTGQATEKRKLNLKVHPDGIRDMGDDRGYSALDLVQEAFACDLDTAFSWLSDKLGRTAQVISLPLNTSPERVKETAVSLTRSAETEGELPIALTRPPGLLGELVDYITASARRPSRIMSLGAALTILGTAAGRQFSGPTRTGTQLYVMPLARTSAGKDHPLKMIMRIMHAAGLAHHVGPSEFISMPAAIKFIGRSPLAVCPMDEFGSFLKRINSRRASGFEGAISGVLRTAWGSSFQMMATPEWAHVESRTIFAPCLSVFGASTPEEFYGSLAAADATNGLMNRFLVLETRTRAAEQEPSADPALVPQAIVDGLRGLYFARGELFAASLNQSDQDRSPAVVPWADEGAAKVYAQFGRYVEGRSDEDQISGAFLGRTVEMAQRIATIAALGREGALAQVSVADMEWGRDVALWSAETMIRGALEHMAENDQQQAMKLVLGLVRQSGQITRNELVRRVAGRLNGRTLDDILKGLVEGEMVWEAQQPASKAGGRPRRVYIFGPPAEQGAA